MPRGWKLMWGKTEPGIVKAASEYPYSRIGADTTLCYGRKRAADGLMEADDAFICQMSSDEQVWLKGCLDRIVAQKASKHKAQTEKNSWEFLRRFEAELEAYEKSRKSVVRENAGSSEE